jgi:hypothetical protein
MGGAALGVLTVTKRQTREQMIQLVDNVLHPKGRGFTSDQINQQLLLFCINCPDPVAAMDIVIEAPAPVTAQQLVERCLASPPREVAFWSECELALTHPLRHMKVESET